MIGLKSQRSSNQNREGGGQNKTTTTTLQPSVVNYAVGEFVMDVRSASLSLIRHPSSQVHSERY